MYLYWIRDADGSWSYVISDTTIIETKTGFRFEFTAIKAGLTNLKQRKQRKMEELQQELNDVNRSIEQVLFGKSNHIGVSPTQETQNELDFLYARRKNIKEIMPNYE